MKSLKVFISSVQTEFAREGQTLFDYLHNDPLPGLFFEPFLFKNIPANPLLAEPMYLAGYIELTLLDSPNHPNQRYRLTTKRIEL